MAPPQESPWVPEQLTHFAESTPGVDHALVFTTDSLVYAYSGGLGQVAAEQWSSMVGSMYNMANQWGEVMERGGCEHLLLKDGAGRILIMEATPCTGLALFLAADASARDCGAQAAWFLEDLSPHLPQEASDKVGGTVLIGVPR